MNPEFPQSPREELEAKLTALILGELPADEAFNVTAAAVSLAKLTLPVELAVRFEALMLAPL